MERTHDVRPGVRAGGPPRTGAGRVAAVRLPRPERAGAAGGAAADRLHAVAPLVLLRAGPGPAPQAVAPHRAARPRRPARRRPALPALAGTGSRRDGSGGR